jgi:FkbM family methyltransferase
MRLLEKITPRNFNHFCQRTTNYQKSQLRQDLFILFVTNFKQNGYFIEAGASDGVTFSNTFTLEKNFNWNGILVEPGAYWKESLNKNRTCHICYKAIWKENSSILFNEVQNKPTLSHISSVNPNSWMFDINQETKSQYVVQSITLLDLLDYYNAPNIIDYLSLDTEGSEYDILSSFNFETYDIKIMTIEHNYSPNREKIFDLLQDKYIRVLTEVSGKEDWYIKKQFGLLTF